MNRILHLKIKIASLAAEARIIRGHEIRLKRGSWSTPDGKTRNWDTFGPAENRSARNERRLSSYVGIRAHRHSIVRRECRHALLAYGFLRERDYRKIEAACHEEPDWAAVARIVRSFSGVEFRRLSDKEAMERMLAWRDDSTVYLAAAAE